MWFLLMTFVALQFHILINRMIVSYVKISEKKRGRKTTNKPNDEQSQFDKTKANICFISLKSPK